MPEQEQVVNPEASTPSEEVVNQDAASTSQPEAEAQGQAQETPDTPPVTPPGQEDVDESGIPWKNRAMEWKRKTEELADRLPQMLDEKLQKFAQPQQQQYTIEQLEAFVEQRPEYAPWAKQEIRRLQEDGIAKTIRSEIDKWRQEESTKQQQAQSFQYVLANHPDAFVKDAQGRPTGQWNNNSPLTKMMGQLMQDPEISKSPKGIIAAADLAAYYISKQQMPKIAQQQAKLKAQVGTLQKKTLIEGGEKAPPAAPPHRAALDKLKQTGKFSDAQAALDMILSARGMQTEE